MKTPTLHTWKEADGSGVHLPLHGKFQASLGYLKDPAQGWGEPDLNPSLQSITCNRLKAHPVVQKG